MGILDDAIREHLDLKRRLGAEEDELQRLEGEAFGPPSRPRDPDFPDTDTGAQALVDDGPGPDTSSELVAEPLPPSRPRPPRSAAAPAEDSAAAGLFDQAPRASSTSIWIWTSTSPRRAWRRSLRTRLSPSRRRGRAVPEERPASPSRRPPPRAPSSPSASRRSSPWTRWSIPSRAQSTTRARPSLSRASSKRASRRPASTTTRATRTCSRRRPEFLRDAPDGEDLWFEQGEPKDFDF